MSFREKIAWAAMLSTLLIWGGYFAVVFTQVGFNHHPPMLYFWLFIGLVVLQAALITLVAIIGAITVPQDARAPADERDRTIARRASTIAYYVLLSSIFAIIAALHVGFDAPMTIFALFAIIVVAEVVRYGVQLVGYRRGA